MLNVYLKPYKYPSLIQHIYEALIINRIVYHLSLFIHLKYITNLFFFKIFIFSYHAPFQKHQKHHQNKFLNLYTIIFQETDQKGFKIWSVAHTKLSYCFSDKGLQPCFWKASVLQISAPTPIKHN